MKIIFYSHRFFCFFFVPALIFLMVCMPHAKKTMSVCVKRELKGGNRNAHYRGCIYFVQTSISVSL